MNSLLEWIPRQRWYSTKHLEPHLEIAGVHEEGDFTVVFVRDTAPAEPVVYQVPIGVGREVPPGVAVIGPADDGGLAWDACTDPRFQQLRLDLDSPVHVRPLVGEQSNTSVICELPGGAVMTKVFRILGDGPNPDVELTEALTRAGCAHVAAFRSAVFAPFPGGSGHLQATNEFIADADDAWRVALAATRAGSAFDAEDLGAAVAEIHTLLAQELGASDADPVAVVAGWHARAESALSTVPELDAHSRAITEVYERALSAEWPRLQRIHGDLHLGQVIHGERGWIVLDFEGEPLRPLADRRRPDLALRDVAGMLRSFDYAQVASDSPDPAWSRRVRQDFLRGYGDIPPGAAPILAALELDKALYEAVYEASSRPAWLHVPLTGIRRLIEGLD